MIANQAYIESGGAMGAPKSVTTTDGDAHTLGSQATLIGPVSDGKLHGGGCGCVAPGSRPERSTALALFLALCVLIRFLSKLSVDDVGAA
jgi:hypothetical protein